MIVDRIGKMLYRSSYMLENENKKYKLAIFDLDGTLLDTSEGIMSSVRYTVDKKKLRELSEDEIKTFIGPPIQNSFKSKYNMDAEEADDCAAVFRARYSSEDLFLAKPYEGIYELLEKLKTEKIMCAVATYKREDYAIPLLKKFHFDNYMDYMYGSDLEGKLLKSDIINKCISDAGVDKTEVVMIGDTINDEKGALALGVDFIGVTYGFGYKDSSDMGDDVHNIACVNSPIDVYFTIVKNVEHKK